MGRALAVQTDDPQALRPLTDQQDLFCQEYVKDFNGSAAYVRAGYSPKGARVSAAQLLAKPNVRARIQQLTAPRLAAAQMDGDEVITQLSRIARADMRKAMRWGTREISVGFDIEGKRLDPTDLGEAVIVHTELAPYAELIDSEDIDDDTAAAIEGLSVSRNGTVRFKMAPKTPALHLLGRIRRLLSEDIAVNANVSFIIANGPPLAIED